MILRRKRYRGKKTIDERLYIKRINGEQGLNCLKDVYDKTKVRVGNYKPMNEWIKTTWNDEIWKDKLISFVQK